MPFLNDLVLQGRDHTRLFIKNICRFTISSTCREIFLTTTASELLRKVCDDKNTEDEIEPELVSKITSNRFITDFLYFQRDDMSRVLKVFNTFHGLPIVFYRIIFQIIPDLFPL